MSASFTVSFSVNASQLTKVLVFLGKSGINPTIGTGSMAMNMASEPVAPKTYDAITCTAIKGNAKLDSLLESYRGEGALKRLMAENALDYTVASPLLSAWKAAKKAKRDDLYIVPKVAAQAKAFVDSLAPKAVLIKASK